MRYLLRTARSQIRHRRLCTLYKACYMKLLVPGVVAGAGYSHPLIVDTRLSIHYCTPRRAILDHFVKHGNLKPHWVILVYPINPRCINPRSYQYLQLAALYVVCCICISQRHCYTPLPPWQTMRCATSRRVRRILLARDSTSYLPRYGTSICAPCTFANLMS